MNIRYATMADLDDIASVEAECFVKMLSKAPDLPEVV